MNGLQISTQMLEHTGLRFTTFHQPPFAVGAPSCQDGDTVNHDAL
jgi:hypothetical protein